MRRLITPIVLALLPLVLVACPPDLQDEQPEPPGMHYLVQFNSCPDLKEHVAEAWTENLVQSRYGWYGGGWLETDDDVAPNDGAGDEGPSDYSETNTQEVGVDEPDLVKTDGEYIYIAQAGELTIVDSWPPEETNKIASLEFEQDAPYAMFLLDDRILLYSYAWDAFGDAGDDWRAGYGTKMTLVDVSDRTAPIVLREVIVEGWFVDARRIGNDVYTVVDSWMGLPWDLWDVMWDDQVGLPEMDWDADEETQEAIRDEAREILRPIVDAFVLPLDSDDLLPRRSEAVAGQMGAPEPLLSCTDLYKPVELTNPSVLSVVHLDMATGAVGGEVSATGLMSEGWTVYASRSNLYVAQSSWWWWWGWGDLDLSTMIHKFELSGAGTQYVASGEVQGWVLNQFSMGEHDDYLRVATTDVDWWWGTGVQEEEAANNVFVMEQRDAALTVVGEVTGIAPGEQVYSARFQGERGFVVTFEQIDPLWTIDLSNPYAPRLVGELEVPGYSAYLHPLDEDFILAIGMDGTDDGQITGLAVSLFDVSDFANPQLADKWTLESDDWSYSEALWNHHAFTFHRDVLSFPAYVWDDGENFSGLIAIKVDTEDGLEELGRVDHADLVSDSACLHGDWDDCYDYYWYAWMRRSVVIEDNLYSISDYGMKVNELETPEAEIARVLFWPVE
jgi:uncharacterized secreted protein with C-terminal beta-propeller domain